jgi:hypothetical protein
MSIRPRKVWHQHFHLGFRIEVPGLANAVSEMLGATILKVIPVYRGNHHISEPHFLDRFCQFPRFVGIKLSRLTVGDIAERAATGADVTHDHKSRRAIAEAFAKIWTGRFLTH